MTGPVRAVVLASTLCLVVPGFSAVAPPPPGTDPGTTGETARRTGTVPSLGFARLGAQQAADTVAADTLPEEEPAAVPVPADSVVADTLAADTLVADSLAADTIPLEHFPGVKPLVPAGWETGVWAWDRDDLLATRAVTLSELLEQVPGVIGLRGGDVGMPRSVTAFGSGGGGVRVFRDGMEFLPLEGSVPDLSRVSISDVESVRMTRGVDGLEIHLRSLEADDPRPYSRIEAGTGDLETNLLEGVFFHPRALGGNAGVSLHRLDTRGPRGAEPGSVTSIKLHYAYLQGEELGIRGGLSRSITDRDGLYVPRRVNRTDWSLQGRWSPGDRWVGEVFWNRASLDADTTVSDFQGFPYRAEPRSQWGGRLAGGVGPLSARVAYRGLSGEGLPAHRFEARASAVQPGWGGVAWSWYWSDWRPQDPRGWRVRGWTDPYLGISLFGSLTEFEHGVPSLQLGVPVGDGEETTLDFLPARQEFSTGTSARAGARFRWRGLDLAGAGLRVERAGVHPLGLPMDRAGVVTSGGERTGWEGRFRVPVPGLDGLALEGSGQVWEEGFVRWPYFPRRTWKGALTFHDTFFPTGNLEIWADVGAEGRDEMTVVAPGDPAAGPGTPGDDPFTTGALTTVPFYRSFYTRLQIRVVTVRLFIRWENFTFRDTNLDFPERVLPRTRVLYGVRWTLWN